MKRFLLLSLYLVLTACANPYEKFYRGVPDARTTPNYIPSTEPLKIYATNDFVRDAEVLGVKGYAAIGESSFTAGSDKATEEQLKQQATKIGAQAVLISTKYAGTISGAIPITLPNNTTSYTSGNATAYGPNGSVTAYGNATTTTYGTQTTMMPYSVQRSSFDAVYFIKRKYSLGVQTQALTDDERKLIQTNSGVHVKFVIEGTPAYTADIFKGDLILKLGEDRVQSTDQFSSLAAKYRGQLVTVTIYREGKLIEKQVQLN